MKLSKLILLAFLLPQVLWARDIQLREGWLLNGTYNATVPSTVMGVLTANGEYPGILEGLAYKDIDKTRFDAPFIYSREFSLTPEDLKGNVFLNLDGISYRANIRLNGKLIADKNTIYGSYRRFQLDITNEVKELNKLEIEVFRAQKGEPNAGYVDWNPRPVDSSMGIFRPVTIHTCGDVLLENLGVNSEVNTATLSEAWLHLSVDAINLSQEEVKGELVGKFEEREFRYPVSLKSGEKKTICLDAGDIAAFHVINPRLWWCRQMGNPELYHMDLKFEVSSQPTDVCETSFGIREIGSYYTREGFMGFQLNGKPVLIRGGGWTDDIFMRDTEERYITQLDYVCDMNLNAIRLENIWGTSQFLFDQCDQKGILVLPGWTCHWEWDSYLGKKCDKNYGGMTSPEDVILMGQYFTDQILWLRNHPSIICWFVGSDMLPLPELERNYREILRQFDKSRPLVTSAKKMNSLISGSSGMKMEGPYNYVAPSYWYDCKAPGGAVGFNTETGIGAQLPQRESLIKMLGEPPWPISEVWNYHCTASNTSMGKVELLKDAVEGRYGEATTLNDFLKKADLINYDGTRAMFEAFRAKEPSTTGIIQWMLNPARPGLYWQLYDHYLVPNAAYYSVKKGNESLQLINDYNGNIIGVNATPEVAKATALLQIYDIKGKLIQTESKEVELTPRKPLKVFRLPEIKDNAFLFLELKVADGTLYQNNYVLSSSPDVSDWEKSDWIATPVKKHADFHALATLDKVKPVVKTIVEKNKLTIFIENNSPVVVFFMRLALKNKAGELIVPAYYSDNYLTLKPGSSSSITCFIPDIKWEKGTCLVLEGWNTDEVKIPLKYIKKK